MNSPHLKNLFDNGGPLSVAFSGYRFREGQWRVAQAVDSAINAGHHLLVEAGTGIGKTLAYLIPALQSGGKILISTGTKTLQDQLYARDLPQLLKAINLPASTALLKGRANYVCLYHLGSAVNDSSLTKSTRRDLERIAQFAQQSFNGDRAECQGVGDDSPAWARAVSTRDNCLGTQCPKAESCFVLNARKNAMSADVLVVNHHLFFADMAIRENGGQEILPPAQVLIFDEAHQVRDIATDFFSDTLSSHQLRDLSRDARREMMVSLPDMPEHFNLADAIDYRAGDCVLAFSEFPEKIIADKVLDATSVDSALSALARALQALIDFLHTLEERAAALSRIVERLEMAAMQLQLWRGESAVSQTPYIHWLAHDSRHFSLHRTPLSIAESMQRQYRALPRSWIFCSATLSLSGDFDMALRDLGLVSAKEATEQDSGLVAEVLCVDSPFDYPNQSRLYIPAHLPAPTERDFSEKLLDEIIPAIRATRGGVFLLCTSHRAVAWFYDKLSARMSERLILAQKILPRQQLLEKFKAHGQAVLIGAHSFWEGIDFPGPTLSLVIVDKLPFAPPDDPLQNAIGERLRAQGGNPFFDLQLPQAAILLKQGAGRLIRSENDWGGLIIGDSRLITKGYGKRLLSALPPMKRAQTLDEMTAFLSSINR